MDGEQLFARPEFDSSDIAAVWPSSAQVAPFPLPELAIPAGHHEQVATPAAPDVPAAVGLMVAASYAALIASLAVATVGSPRSIMAIFISGLFVIIFFAVPRVFFAVEPDTRRRVGLSEFLERGIETLTGHNDGKAALVQILIIPVLLTLGVLLMGVVIAVTG